MDRHTPVLAATLAPFNAEEGDRSWKIIPLGGDEKNELLVETSVKGFPSNAAVYVEFLGGGFFTAEGVHQLVDALLSSLAIQRDRLSEAKDD